MKLIKAAQYALLMALSITMLYACGGSSGGSSAAPAEVTGSAFASYIEGAQITVKDTSGNIVAGPVTTGAFGNYSIEIPAGALNQDLIFESYSGTYIDEAFGAGYGSVTAGTLCAYVAAGTLSSGSNISATPASTVICELIRTHKMERTAAQTAFSKAFGYTPDITINPTDMTAPAVDATDAQKLAGRRAGAFSYLILDHTTLAPEDLSLFLAGLAKDLTDSKLDGTDSDGFAVIVEGKAADFTIPSDIFNKVATTIFNKIEKTTSYKVEYIPLSMMTMEGKSSFQLKITDAETGLTGQTGLSISLMPMMYMLSGMNHSTPNEGCTEDGSGLYTCSLYYAMASAMNGESMGYWDLEVIIGGTKMNGMMMGGERVHFYPSVMMRMDGDTNKVSLKGQTDMIEGMMGMPEQRTYYIYNDGATVNMMSGHDIKLFIAAKESMMSFPDVSAATGSVLSSGTDYELTVSTMTVEVTADDGTSWTTATDDGNGQWTATGVAGMTTDVTDTVYVKITVNDEQKTTSGFAPDGAGNIADTNEYGKLTITPGAMVM